MRRRMKVRLLPETDVADDPGRECLFFKATLTLTSSGDGPRESFFAGAFRCDRVLGRGQARSRFAPGRANGPIGRQDGEAARRFAQGIMGIGRTSWRGST